MLYETFANVVEEKVMYHFFDPKAGRSNVGWCDTHNDDEKRKIQLRSLHENSDDEGQRSTYVDCCNY